MPVAKTSSFKLSARPVCTLRRPNCSKDTGPSSLLKWCSSASDLRLSWSVGRVSDMGSPRSLICAEIGVYCVKACVCMCILNVDGETLIIVVCARACVCVCV